MAPARKRQHDEPIGEILRRKRVEVLNKGLREMAKVLAIAPAHLTDIEKGRRTPSEALLQRITEAYGIEIAELRSAWSKADEIVSEVATQDRTTAEKVPAFLRTARKLTAKQWDQLIRQAERMASGGRKRKEP